MSDPHFTPTAAQRAFLDDRPGAYLAPAAVSDIAIVYYLFNEQLERTMIDAEAQIIAFDAFEATPGDYARMRERASITELDALFELPAHGTHS